MLALIAAVTISPVLFLSNPVSPSGYATAPSMALQDAQKDQGRVLGDIFELLDDKYVRELDSKKLFESGLKALLQGLDPHTQFYNPEEAREFRRNLEDKFGGIGVILDPEPSDYPRVIARFIKGPALRSGLQKGDQIVDVDGQSTRGWAYEQIAGKLMGRVGTSVTLSVRRPGEEKLKTLAIKRGTISVSSIRGLDATENGLWLEKDSGIGYIRISRFAVDTASGFKSALSQLKKGEVRSLVIDLRGNPGGLLTQAVKTADIFVDSGLIVRVVGRDGKEEKWMARKGEEVTMPLAVLVDGDSASASEVLAACLQDHRRAVIVGSRSYGKGSVQRLFNVGKDGAMVKMTTELYFPASGRNIDKLTKPEGSDVWGISPDPGLEVTLDQAEREAWMNRFFERDLHVGTDMELPPYDTASDKVLAAAREALRKLPNGS